MQIFFHLLNGECHIIVVQYFSKFGINLGANIKNHKFICLLKFFIAIIQFPFFSLIKLKIEQTKPIVSNKFGLFLPKLPKFLRRPLMFWQKFLKVNECVSHFILPNYQNISNFHGFLLWKYLLLLGFGFWFWVFWIYLQLYLGFK